MQTDSSRIWTRVTDSLMIIASPNSLKYEYFIIMMSCCWHGFPWLSLTTRLSSIALSKSFRLHPPSAQVLAGRPIFARPCKGVHRNTLLRSSAITSLACLVRLTCIVLQMGGRWPYSWCFIGCFFFFTSYISEAMGSSTVDVKTDEPNDRSMPRITRCWVD